MYLVIRFEDGQLAEAMLLVKDERSMRVALKGAGDVIELRQSAGQWTTADGGRVEFEAILAEGAQAPVRAAAAMAH